MSRFGTLEVQLTSASDLPNVAIWGFKQDPFCLLTCETNRVRSVTHQDGGIHPIWNQTFIFSNVTDASVLLIELFDENFFVRETKIGYSKTRLRKVVEVGYDNVQAPVYTDRHQQQGYISLQLKFREAGQQHGSTRRASPSIIQSQVVDKFSIFYTMGPCLRQGAFSKTYEVTHVNTGAKHACKIISKRRLTTAAQRAAVDNEISIMHLLSSHPNILTIKQVFEDSRHVYIVTELLTGPALFDHLTKVDHFTERHASKLLRSILQAVAFAHSKGIALRDMNPDNILFASASLDAPLKIADFAAAASVQQGENLFDTVGVVQYLAPEVLRKSYGKPADVWACGVLLYILLSGRFPFNGKTERMVAESILRSEIDYVSDPWPGISGPAKDCVRRMLMRDPRSRPTAEALLQHDWLREGGVALDEPMHKHVHSMLRDFNGADKFRKQAQLLIAQKLPASNIERLNAAFKAMDQDGDGCITVSELKSVLADSALLKEEDLAALIANADLSGDGSVDYAEFIAATMHLEKVNREERLREAFDEFDLDGNGTISMEELQTALQNLHVKDVESILKQVDADNDGQIDYREFCAMMATWT